MDRLPSPDISIAVRVVGGQPCNPNGSEKWWRSGIGITRKGGGVPTQPQLCLEEERG